MNFYMKDSDLDTKNWQGLGLGHQDSDEIEEDPTTALLMG
jgi:hypothetical protein